MLGQASHPGCIYLTLPLQDIILAKELFAFSPLAQKTTSIASHHGVDLILGGHDHIYFASRGVTSWENFDVNESVLGAESDDGDILVIKSGTDFRDLSEINLKLISTPDGSVRKKVISEISGQL
jgi:2',3'-cyclic-nucleotide 2'-phosphodiesterase (5'-nucleotidase family)